jgi:hypothetical protein
MRKTMPLRWIEQAEARRVLAEKRVEQMETSFTVRVSRLSWILGAKAVLALYSTRSARYELPEIGARDNATIVADVC